MAASYYVLLGDVVSSRNIARREEFQLRLQHACAEAAKQFSATVHARIKLLKGTDEIGAVLNSWQDAFDIVSIILDEIHPYQIRFSLVRGVIDVGENSDDVAKMDGPAFHAAASIINELKQNGLLFQMITGDPQTDMSISNQVSMLLLLRQRWTAKHHQVVMEYRKNETQQFIASKMKITQQEVSRLLRQIHWKQYRIMENLVRNQFKSFGSGGNK
ncbi:MAG: SatD family protein [Desulfuromonadaceae bacterium]|nr:SatD family protein [Desulfuromonadaceae bacterium]MDD2847362.1 SatD family protein [Desulfuromonadaceae bacterium]MDD4131525.1 SatD family protein [Desulfuromonadaceae bacterium]